MEAKSMFRLLREFPWLWAIQDFWNPSIVTIRVERALMKTMNDRRVIYSSEYATWIVYECNGGLYRQRLDAHEPRPLLSALESWLKLHDPRSYSIRFIVETCKRMGEDTRYFTVIKPPKNLSFNALIIKMTGFQIQYCRERQ